jgi:pyruvate dehydrogenase (quinone)/pyruvate oxidase
MARSHTASDQLVERLIEWGIDVVFGLPGDGINGVMESLRTHQDRIRFIHVRHEQTAALAACAYGKFTGRPAACLSTAAPGAIHLMNGLYDARIDQAPVVAITGMTYHDVIGTHYLQDINHDYVLNDPCVYSQRIMGEAHVIPAVDMAVRSAIGHRGPAAIAIPIDIQSGDSVTADRSIKNIEGHSASPRPRRSRQRASGSWCRRRRSAAAGRCTTTACCGSRVASFTASSTGSVMRSGLALP